MKHDLPDTNSNDVKRCTIYFDGACPLCAKEISTYKKWRGANQINWVDASCCTEQELGTQLERSQALAKLHARDANGLLVSGAAAFAKLWSQLPALRWLIPLLRYAWILRFLDNLYLVFLYVRPLWRKPQT